MKYMRKLTGAEKEERKIRRVMANRESARQTIRRRQAMHLELTKKVEDALEENENLKKQKELKVEEYNSLKARNDFLKAQLYAVKKAEVAKEQNSSKAKGFCSAAASTSVFQHTQPSVVPCFWPSIPPYSSVFPFQCMSHPHNISSSQFPMPPEGLHQGQESNPRPLFVVPIPWMIPLLTHSSPGRTHTFQCSCSKAKSSDHVPSRQNMRAEASNHMETHVCADSDGTSGIRQPPDTSVVPGLFKPVRGRETIEPCQLGGSGNLTLVSASLGSIRHVSSQKVTMSSPRKAENMYVAAQARRRRKELMRLKNIHGR